jgi:hypothetical protein
VASQTEAGGPGHTMAGQCWRWMFQLGRSILAGHLAWSEVQIVRAFKEECGSYTFAMTFDIETDKAADMT